MQKVLQWTLIIPALFVVGIVILHFFPPAGPYHPLGGDYVEPAVIHPGDTVTVHRNFTGKKGAYLFISRKMTQGDCAVRCISYELPGGFASIPEGENHDVKRAYQVPVETGAGQWRFEFFVLWDDVLGQKHATPMPVLYFEVVK